MQIKKVNEDEPAFESKSGKDMKIIVHTVFNFSFHNLIQNPKRIHALVFKESVSKILSDLNSLREWIILPKNDLLPIDKKKGQNNIPKDKTKVCRENFFFKFPCLMHPLLCIESYFFLFSKLFIVFARS